MDMFTITEFKHTILKIFKIQEKPAHTTFFIFQIYQKLQFLKKLRAQFFKLYQVLVINKRKSETQLCLLVLKLIKNLIFHNKRAGFFVIQ